VLGSYLQSALLRLDGWENAVTGLGTALDKTVAALFSRNGAAAYGDEYFGQLYEDDPLARRICEKIPDEMLRAGFDLLMGDADNAQQLATSVRDALKDLHAIARVKDALVWERVHGGGAVFIGAEDGVGDSALPLDEERLQAITHLTVIDKPTMVAKTWYGPAERGAGRPATWEITPVDAGGSGPIEVHESRLLLFPGGRVTHKRRIELRGWGQSTLRAIHDALRDYNMSWAGVSHMLQSANQDVWYMDGLKNALASGSAGMREFFSARFAMAQQKMGPNHAIALDSEREKFERHPSTLTGIPETLQQVCLRMSAISDMPLTVLFGMSPAGMNATGESDLQIWHSAVGAMQGEKLQPALERLIRLLMISDKGPTGGEEIEGWSIRFRALRTLSEIEQADLRAKQAGTDKLYVDMTALLPEEVATNRFRPEGFSTATSIDLDVRKQIMAAELQRMDEPDDPAKDDSAAGDPAPDGGAPAGGDTTTVADTAMNGAQVASLLEVIQAVAAETIPRATGVQLLIRAFQLTAEQAELLMGDVGRGFEPKKPAAPQAFGGLPKPPVPPEPDPATTPPPPNTTKPKP
jgi:phage-related protein (TIGR01555 family)